jgi:plastocyanin
MKKALPPTLLVATLALLSGCGGNDTKSTDSSSPAKTATAIQISNFLYKPDPITVKAGAKVSITNEDDTAHTVTDKGTARTFDSGTIKGNATGTVTFSKPGTYAYFCEFHPTMAGKVTVTK